MKKLILLSIALGSYMFAGIHGDSDTSKSLSNEEKLSWVADSSDDNFKSEAGRRRGKGNRDNIRRGGGGLR